MMDPQVLRLIIIIVSLITIACCAMLGAYCKRKVIENSARYHALLVLNERYRFHNDIEQKYVYKKELNSKAQFDRFNFGKYISELIENNMDFFTYIIKKANENQLLSAEYKKELSALPNPADEQEAKERKVPFCIYQRLEKKLVQKQILQPVVSPSVVCKISYTSPKGRNSYASHKDYSFCNIIEYCELVKGQIEARNTKEYQRKRMTPSLRYDILKRDKFSCAICGRSEKDGVKLHVDHIIPVSKGGRTEYDNLRTLCNDCNLGKSDKYDPKGIN